MGSRRKLLEAVRWALQHEAPHGSWARSAATARLAATAAAGAAGQHSSQLTPLHLLSYSFGLRALSSSSSSSSTAPVAADSSAPAGAPPPSQTGPGAAAGVAGAATAAADASAAAAEVVSAVKQSLPYKLAKFVFGLAAVGAAGACGYVTYVYDTKTLRSRLDNIRQEWKVEGSWKDEMKDRPLSALVTSPSSWSHLARAGLVDLAHKYIEMREDAEERLHEFTSPSSDKLLPDLLPQERHVFTLVLDLDGTLVVSDWRRDRGWRTFKRPGVDAFLERMAQFFEVVVFTDQLNMAADPILDRLDSKGCIRYRLYRDGTLYTKGNYVKDLSKLNRDAGRVLYITTKPETTLQGENVVRIPEWNPENNDEKADTALLDLLPFLECVARQRPADARAVLESYEGEDIPTAFKERAKEYQKQLQEKKQQGLFRFRRPAGS